MYSYYVTPYFKGHKKQNSLKMFLHCPILKWRPLTCTDLMDVLAAIDMLDIHIRCKPPFCIRASPTLFRTCYLFCLTILKMRYHTIGVHLKFSIYPHQPQFGGWYGADKTLRLDTLSKFKRRSLLQMHRTAM